MICAVILQIACQELLAYSLGKPFFLQALDIILVTDPKLEEILLPVLNVIYLLRP